MNFSDVDVTKLSDIQRRNLAVVRIKQALLRRRYGDGIVIATSLDDVLAETGPCAIPLDAINTNKILSIYMDDIREDARGRKVKVRDKARANVADDVESLTEALERTADILEGKLDVDNFVEDVEDFEVPAGYKLVKIEDEGDQNKVEDTVEETEQVETADLGRAIPAEAKQPASTGKLSEAEAFSQLLNMLI